ncbi:hypothetical protein AACH28_18855 [Sphingobacterium thalpophilum]|uniref:Uncharacterized protein n=1 Tax=Sphingobacterium thalpophilum TaxID=259 RepID=A0ACD5BYH8_9SPHI
MNRILALQFAFDRLIYDVHKADYDPIKEIETFWNRYALDTISDNILELLGAYVNDEMQKDWSYIDEEMYEFATELYRVLIAYCVANYRPTDLTKLELSAKARERIAKELEMSKKIVDFFGRLSK